MVYDYYSRVLCPFCEGERDARRQRLPGPLLGVQETMDHGLYEAMLQIRSLPQTAYAEASRRGRPAQTRGEKRLIGQPPRTFIHSTSQKESSPKSAEPRSTAILQIRGRCHGAPQSPPGPHQNTPALVSGYPVWARQRSPIWSMRPRPPRRYNRFRFRPGSPLFPPPRNGGPAFFLPLLTRARGRAILRTSPVSGSGKFGCSCAPA
jgi:hypothetical protein